MHDHELKEKCREIARRDRVLRAMLRFSILVIALLLLVMVVLLVVPLPLSWWLPYTETENTVWCCAAKVYDERPITELDEADAREFAEVLEQTTVRFRGWSEDDMRYPYLQLFQLEAGSGKRLSDTRTFSFDEQGLLVVDDFRFSLAGASETAFCEAFERACDASLAQKFKNS